MDHTQTCTATPTPMVVLSTAEGGRRIRVRDGDGGALWTTNATSAVFAPDDSALVLLASDCEAYAIGMIPGAPRSRVETEGGTIRVLNPDGQIALEYDAHASKVRLVGASHLEVATPSGDLTLAAGERVHISAGAGIDLSSAGTVRSMTPGASTLLGNGEYRVAADRLDVASRATNASVGKLSVAGTRASIVFDSVRATVDRVESISEVVVCRTRDLFTDASRLAQTTASRVRLVVRDGFSLRSGRTHMRSQQATRIDGDKIHLG